MLNIKTLFSSMKNKVKQMLEKVKSLFNRCEEQTDKLNDWFSNGSYFRNLFAVIYIYSQVYALFYGLLVFGLMAPELITGILFMAAWFYTWTYLVTIVNVVVYAIINLTSKTFTKTSQAV